MGFLRSRAPLIVAALAIAGVTAAAQGTDLDAFMRQVLAKRDENWKKLQQYVLDERTSVDMKGPGGTAVWGDRREYTWYIRDGMFVRSPVKANGVTISDADRRKYEEDFLKSEQRRERRRRGNDQSAADAPAPGGTDRPADAPDLNADGLLRQSREPGFISSAYFLRFRFEEGKYALVGHETLDGRDVLKIEYYPTNLFRGSDRRRNERRSTNDDDRAYDAEFRRLMNKTALITLWVEPSAHQIVKYTFDNVALDFLPAQWLVQMDELHATMTMGQPFKSAGPAPEVDIWLPNTLQFQGALTTAMGPFSLVFGTEYRDYRRAGVTSKLTVPKGE